MGKHEPIGIATFNLNPKAFGECATRDIVLPLSPRGMVHLRISMDGGERHDIAYHLSTATRALDRVENDMVREIVDRMSEFMRAQLSVQTITAMTKVLKDKKKPRAGLSEGEIEGSLIPLFEYLNENVSESALWDRARAVHETEGAKGGGRDWMAREERKLKDGRSRSEVGGPVESWSSEADSAWGGARWRLGWCEAVCRAPGAETIG